MRIAFLILAHQDPVLLERLTGKLSEIADNDIFIHIDAKQDSAPFLRAAQKRPNVHFISRRISVNHGGFSITKAILLLMQEARSYGAYDYYQCLSGLDYPIKSLHALVEKYKSAPEVNYIDTHKLEKGARFSENLYEYHFVDSIAKVPAQIRNRAVQLKKLINKVKADSRPFLPGIVPHRGSCWWALPQDTVNRILDYLSTPEGRRFSNYFRFTWGSDETFIQTLTPLLAAGPIENYLHHIDWSPARENPAVLDESDFQVLLESPQYFCRKVRSEKSARLLNLIDESMF